MPITLPGIRSELVSLEHSVSGLESRLPATLAKRAIFYGWEEVSCISASFFAMLDERLLTSASRVGTEI